MNVALRPHPAKSELIFARTLRTRTAHATNSRPPRYRHIKPHKYKCGAPARTAGLTPWPESAKKEHPGIGLTPTGFTIMAMQQILIPALLVTTALFACNAPGAT